MAHDASLVVSSPRSTWNLNPGWRMATGEQQGAERTEFDDRSWSSVTLPHAFNEKEAFARD